MTKFNNNNNKLIIILLLIMNKYLPPKRNLPTLANRNKYLPPKPPHSRQQQPQNAPNPQIR